MLLQNLVLQILDDCDQCSNCDDWSAEYDKRDEPRALRSWNHAYESGFDPMSEEDW